MDRLKQAKLKSALSDIIAGFSIIKTKEYGAIYAKHFDTFDTTSVEGRYEEAFNLALSRGLPTTDEQIKRAISSEDWTESEEKKTKTLPYEIQNLQLTRTKTVLKKEREILAKEIVEREKELEELEMRRYHCVGYSAEIFAAKKMNEYFVYFAFRKKDMTTFFFTQERFDELEEEELSSLVLIHNAYAQRFSSPEMKKIAISIPFLNLISVAGEEIFSFYGKPVVQLTHRQIELYILGKQYRRLLSESNNDIPDGIEDNPDKLVEHVENKKNIEEFNKRNNKEEDVGVSIMGASKEDIQKMGLEKEKGATSLQEEAAKKGGSLTMDDLIRIHGL